MLQNKTYKLAFIRVWQITKSVVEHQLNQYIEDKLKELGDDLSEEDKEEMKKEMKEQATEALYPGKSCFRLYLWYTSFIIVGLEGGPTFLADAMQPNTSPEVAAEAKVLVEGGFDAWFVFISPCSLQVDIMLYLPVTASALHAI